MQKIDLAVWPRAELFRFFSAVSQPFYSVTFRVDVTNLHAYARAHGVSFYYALGYLVTDAVNAVENFRYTIRSGEVWLLDERVPSFTDLKPGSELFQIVTVEAAEDAADFCRRAKAQAAAQTEFINSGPWDGDQLVYFTCLPWFPLTALKNEKDVNPSDSVPRAAWGRWEEKGSRTRLLLSLELNHRLLDGVHVGRFYEALNRWMEGL